MTALLCALSLDVVFSVVESDTQILSKQKITLMSESHFASVNFIYICIYIYNIIYSESCYTMHGWLEAKHQGCGVHTDGSQCKRRSATEAALVLRGGVFTVGELVSHVEEWHVHCRGIGVTC